MLLATLAYYSEYLRTAQRVEPPAADSIKIYTWPNRCTNSCAVKGK